MKKNNYSNIVAKHNRLEKLICDLFNAVENTDTYIREYQLVDGRRVDVLSFAKKTIIEVKLNLTSRNYTEIISMFSNISKSYPDQFKKFYIIAQNVKMKKEFVFQKNKQFEKENNSELFLWDINDIKSKIENFPQLQNKYSIDLSPYKGSEIQIKNISIRNIKCFNETQINFQQKSNIILGINGRGKTTILQLLALGLTDEIKPDTKNEWINVVKMGNKTGEFEISVIIDKNEKVFKYKINNKDEISCIENREDLQKIFSSYLVLAYGANRGISKSELSNKIKYEDIASLFNDNSYFKSIGQTGVYDFVKNNFIKIQDIINDIFIGSDTEFLLDNFTKETFLFKTPTIPKNADLIKLEAMPSGFRVMFIWIFDMIWRASEIYQIEIGDKNNFRGIVLIDEIDKHLHPSWQRQILPTLNKNFPNIQFVFTTHSPFIVQSLENKSLTILKTEEDGTITRKLNIKGKPFGYEIEKIIERIMGENEIPEISAKLKTLLIDIKEAVEEENKQKVIKLHSEILSAVPEDSDYIDWVNILTRDFLTN